MVNPRSSSPALKRTIRASIAAREHAPAIRAIQNLEPVEIVSGANSGPWRDPESALHVQCELLCLDHACGLCCRLRCGVWPAELCFVPSADKDSTQACGRAPRIRSGSRRVV